MTEQPKSWQPKVVEADGTMRPARRSEQMVVRNKPPLKNNASMQDLIDLEAWVRELVQLRDEEGEVLEYLLSDLRNGEYSVADLYFGLWECAEDSEHKDWRATYLAYLNELLPSV
jgi:hypothetical protein